MKAHETVRWHGLQIAEAVELLDTDLDKGLSENETGRIAWLFSEAVNLSTPLTRRVDEFSRYAGGQLFQLAGTGYDPAGELRLDSPPTAPRDHPALIECLKAGLLCNDSQLVHREGRWEMEDGPTEAAIVAFEKRLRARAEADRGSDATLEPAAHRI
jgi:hypothetical protein